nr:MAG TPA: hypothetical protein [Caudoviricetes sp.]
MHSIVSIHALLAECDLKKAASFKAVAVSIHALLAECDWNPWMRRQGERVSIHALLAECDLTDILRQNPALMFQSTHSLRSAT